MTQYCSSCGSELVPNAKFCNKCGQAVAAMPQEEAPSPEPPSGDRPGGRVRRWFVGASTPWTVMLVVSVVLAVCLVGVGAWLALAGNGEEEEGTPTARGSPPAGAVGATGTPGATASPGAKVSPTPPGAVAASVDDDPYLGPMDAPVTIIEFSDFECPFCKRFRDETLDQLLQTYEGKIRFVFRDFPISSSHAWAEKAAEAAECAHDQDKFWEYHDKLFSNQSALDVASLKSYASDLGLDTAVFNDCLDTGKHTAEVQQDSQDAQTYGVKGVPVFFINGVLVEGARPFSDFQQAIDAALTEKVSPTPPGAAAPDACVLQAAPQGQANLFHNPGFESGREPWCSLYPEKVTPFEVSQDFAHSGESSALLRMRVPAEEEGKAKVFYLVQEVLPEQFPQLISGYYRVENWTNGTPKQYLQFVVIAFGATNLPGGYPNHQMRYPLAGISEEPFAIANAFFVFIGKAEPHTGEWVYFERNIKQDFEELWGAAPEGFSKIRVLFEVRYDDKEAGLTPASADVYYDDLYMGPASENPNGAAGLAPAS